MTDQRLPNLLETSGPEGSRRRRGRWILFLMVTSTASVAAAGAGYSLARGAWSIPASIAAKIPEPLAQWLPLSSPLGPSASPPAELQDYAFELLGGDIPQGSAVLDVRLVDKLSGKLVPNAVIFARRLDMAPEGMPTMTSILEPQPAPQPGVYRFKTELTMEGGWRLSLAAKVQGKTGTVQSKLVLKAAP